MNYPFRPENATVESIPVHRVTGQFLAKNRLGARERAKLAADLIEGRVALGPLTTKQIVVLCRTNAVYVGEVRFPDRAKRRQQKKLAAVFDAIGPDARAEACRTIGVERIWAALTAAL